MVGVESYILERIRKEGTIHMSLLDPENIEPEDARLIASEAEALGTAAIMVGGTTLASVDHLNAVVKAIKSAVKVPVILFPNNVTGISPYADAIWFMSLLNSTNPYFLIGAQALGSAIVKRYGLEPIPMGYIILGEGGAAGFMGQAQLIPYDKPEIAALYALAAQFLGMRFVYLEAGSRARYPIPPSVIAKVRETIDIPLIVGGGIRTPEDAEVIVKAGANIVVTGTMLEEKPSNFKPILGDIVKVIRKAGMEVLKNFGSRPPYKSFKSFEPRNIV